jgi:hypothetical protein
VIEELAPGTEPASRRASGLAATSGKVWVNTRSGKCWKSGSRYYGATKQGEFMIEKEAVQKGYQSANGGTQVEMERALFWLRSGEGRLRRDREIRVVGDERTAYYHGITPARGFAVAAGDGDTGAAASV